MILTGLMFHGLRLRLFDGTPNDPQILALVEALLAAVSDELVTMGAMTRTEQRATESAFIGRRLRRQPRAMLPDFIIRVVEGTEQP